MVFFFGLFIFSIVNFFVLYFLLFSLVDKRLSSQKILEREEGKLNQLLVMMGDTVDQHISLMEEKVKQLRSATDLANRKISLLEKESYKFEQGRQVYHELSKKRSLIHSVIEIKKDQSKCKDGNLEIIPEKKGDLILEKRRENFEQIVQLSRCGKTSSEIASLLGLALAEVEFTLSVCTNQRTYPNL